MSALEAAVGQDLLIRLGRGVRLTDAGHVMVGHAREIIAANEAAANALQRADDDRPVTVNLGIFTSAAVAYLPELLALLARTSPQITVNAHEISLTTVHERLAQGRLDVALGVDYPNYPVMDYQALTVVRMQSEPFHLLSSDPEPLTIARLNEVDWVMPPYESHFGASIRLALHAVGVTPRVRHVLSNHVAAIALAEAGLGVTPATETTSRLRAHHCHEHRFPGDPERLLVALAQPASLERRSVRQVIDGLRCCLPQ
ncbi:LysR family transcriptional regulator [Gordonia sp. (in: high G+C Gram-positive bacteria)]|uniref:LysR family transcriptional regulator n=1 Tax=Gordonia sp. (in: high G+C Gram-positive bacteria) TaxID=84139 RepID=UPI003C7098B3